MTEFETLQQLRRSLLEQICRASDEIKRIDLRLSFLQNQEADE